MDIVYFIGYTFVLALLRNKWGFIALSAFLVSLLSNDSKLYFIITALCYTPICLHNDKKVAISSLIIVISFYIMAWENAINSTYYLNHLMYVSFVTALNFMLITSLIKDKVSDFYHTHFFRLYNN